MLLPASNPTLAFTNYLKSILIQPFFSSAWQNLGHLCREHFSLLMQLCVLRTQFYLNQPITMLIVILDCVISRWVFLRKAESSFLTALVIHPLFPPAYINLTNLFLADRRPQEAINLISSIPDSTDLSPHLLFNLSLCHLLMGNYSSGWMFYEYRLKTDQVPEDSFQHLDLRY